MSLKDSSELVKMYAMVNVGQYNLVATGNTVAQCESNYVAMLQERGFELSIDSSLPSVAENQVSGVVAEIRTAVLDGTSHYFIRLVDSNVFYIMAASANKEVVILSVGDTVTISSTDTEGDTPLMSAYSLQIH